MSSANSKKAKNRSLKIERQFQKTCFRIKNVRRVKLGKMEQATALPEIFSEQQKEVLSKMNGKYFHFTIPNYSDSDILKELPKQLCYLVMGKEGMDEL